MTARQRANRLNGSKGGKKTAEKGKDFLEARARKGGQTTLLRYGRQYYKQLRRMRKKAA